MRPVASHAELGHTTNSGRIGGSVYLVIPPSKHRCARCCQIRLHATLRRYPALNHSAQFTHNPNDIAEFEQLLAAVRAALDVTMFDALWGRGQKLSLEQAVALALDDIGG
jgi:hypothetical protein